MKLQSTIRHIRHAWTVSARAILSHAFSTLALTSHVTDQGALHASVVDAVQLSRDENSVRKGCRVGLFIKWMKHEITEDDVRSHFGRFGEIREVIMRPRSDSYDENAVTVYFDTVKAVDDTYEHIYEQFPSHPFSRFGVCKMIRGWPPYDEESFVVANLHASATKSIIAGLFAGHAVSSIEMLTGDGHTFLGYARVTFSDSTTSHKVFARAAQRPLLVEGKALALIPCGWLMPVQFPILLVSGLLRESDASRIRDILQEHVHVRSVNNVYLSDDTFGHATCVRFFSERAAERVLESHSAYPLKLNGRELNVTHLKYFQFSSRKVKLSLRKAIHKIIDAERAMESAKSQS